MDNLEKFIRDNRTSFDQNEPPKDLWDKIDKERSKPHRAPRLSIRPIRAMRIAASIAILLLAGFGGYKLLSPDSQPAVAIDQPATEQILPAEIVEMDRYYEEQVNAYYTQLNTLIEDQEVMDEIKADLDILNQEKQRLFEEYGTEVSNEEVIEALINTYRMKTQVLENILSLIKEQENEDTSI